MFNLDDDQNFDREEQKIFDEECDDPLNYLKIRINEVIGERYKVVKYLGKGMFASVCQAIDL